LVLPDDFTSRLDAKTFTCKTQDFERVATLYSDAFTTIQFQTLGWKDPEISSFASVIKSPLFQAKSVNLQANEITDVSANALAAALQGKADACQVTIDDCYLSRAVSEKLTKSSNGQLLVRSSEM